MGVVEIVMRDEKDEKLGKSIEAKSFHNIRIHRWEGGRRQTLNLVTLVVGWSELDHLVSRGVLRHDHSLTHDMIAKDRRSGRAEPDRIQLPWLRSLERARWMVAAGVDFHVPVLLAKPHSSITPIMPIVPMQMVASTASNGPSVGPQYGGKDD